MPSRGAKNVSGSLSLAPENNIKPTASNGLGPKGRPEVPESTARNQSWAICGGRSAPFRRLVHGCSWSRGCLFAASLCPPASQPMTVCGRANLHAHSHIHPPMWCHFCGRKLADWQTLCPQTGRLANRQARKPAQMRADLSTVSLLTAQPRHLAAQTRAQSRGQAPRDGTRVELEPPTQLDEFPLECHSLGHLIGATSGPLLQPKAN